MSCAQLDRDLSRLDWSPERLRSGVFAADDNPVIDLTVGRFPSQKTVAYVGGVNPISLHPEGLK